MNYKMFLLGGLVYVIIAMLLTMMGAMLPINLAPYAVLIGALIAGIYVGRKAMSPMRGAIDGMIACVIGGVIGGAITIYVSPLIPSSTGVPFVDQIVNMLGGMLSQYVGVFAWYVSMGLILGVIGGFIGTKLRR